MIGGNLQTRAYFAFGSNMDLKQMSERVGYQGTPRAAKLECYQLVFNKFAQNRNCGAGNLHYTGHSTDIVEGIVFDLTEDQFVKLDQNEGYRIATGELSNYQYGYKRLPITLADGTRADTYIATCIHPQHNNLKPSAAYLKHFLEGRKNGFLSESYCNNILNTDVQEGGKLSVYINAADFSWIPQSDLQPHVTLTPLLNARINNLQAQLLIKIQNGLQIGAVNLLEQGACLDAQMVAVLKDPTFIRNNPKTTQALQPYVNAYENKQSSNVRSVR